MKELKRVVTEYPRMSLVSSQVRVILFVTCIIYFYSSKVVNSL